MQLKSGDEGAGFTRSIEPGAASDMSPLPMRMNSRCPKRRTLVGPDGLGVGPWNPEGRLSMTVKRRPSRSTRDIRPVFGPLPASLTSKEPSGNASVFMGARRPVTYSCATCAVAAAGRIEMAARASQQCRAEHPRLLERGPYNPEHHQCGSGYPGPCTEENGTRGDGSRHLAEDVAEDWPKRCRHDDGTARNRRRQEHRHAPGRCRGAVCRGHDGPPRGPAQARSGRRCRYGPSRSTCWRTSSGIVGDSSRGSRLLQGRLAGRHRHRRFARAVSRGDTTRLRRTRPDHDGARPRLPIRRARRRGRARTALGRR